MEKINGFTPLSPPDRKQALIIILLSFLATFITIRSFVYAALRGWIPHFYIKIKDVHVHHLCIGIALLSYVGIYTLLWANSQHFLNRTYIVYGAALSLTFDEFAMWLHLDNNYWNLLNFVAVAIIILILLNLIFFNTFWRKVGSKIPFVRKKLIN